MDLAACSAPVDPLREGPASAGPSRYTKHLPHKRITVTVAVIERRKSKRFELAFPVSAFAVGSPPVRGTTQNISSSGVLFISSATIPVGERAEFTIEFPRAPHGQRVVLTSVGRVVRAARTCAGGNTYLIAATLERSEISRRRKYVC